MWDNDNTPVKSLSSWPLQKNISSGTNYHYTKPRYSYPNNKIHNAKANKLQMTEEKVLFEGKRNLKDGT